MKRIPQATYRLQFTPGFGFDKAGEILDYLGALGVSHIYASPVFKARPGSEHGYDVCGHRSLNPELGGEEAFDDLARKLKDLGLGWIQDIVPNHMAVSGHNRMLVDVWENGPASRYHPFFDIDWDHPNESIKGRMLAPFLGSFYGETLSRGELSLGFDEDGFFVAYYDLRFPLGIDTYARVLEHGIAALRASLGREHPDYIKLMGILYAIRTLPATDQDRYDQVFFIKKMLWELHQTSSEINAYLGRTLDAFNGQPEAAPETGRFDLLNSLLLAQYYRLSFWKVAGDEINYRRFFSINDLISMRAEQEEVFDHTHETILRMVRQGVFTGLRVDHIDGLYDPTAYLRRLRETAGDVYLTVEKILTDEEPLPSFWPVAGTTGYEFMNLVAGLFVDTEAEKDFDETYRRHAKEKRTYEDLVVEKKRLILKNHMSGDVDNLARFVNTISSKDIQGYDITQRALRKAISEFLCHFPVYRTYISNDAFRPVDLTYIRQAIRRTRRKNPQLKPEFDFLERFLLLEFDEFISPEDKRDWIHFVMRFQQITGPLTAKGVEDTTFYVFNRLLALNEVGGEPAVFGVTARKWHELMTRRAREWPQAMNATATHDGKRGEDARMRLAALSEMPNDWREALAAMRKASTRHRGKINGKTVPTGNDEYFLFQTLLATWPLDGHDSQEWADYPGRISDYLVKAVREAKENSAWINPNEEYEQAYLNYAMKIMEPGPGDAFLEVFLPLQERVAALGMVNSLSQVVLKATAPGVPDHYQGTEFWDFSLVDPDNRRPVDYMQRKQTLEGFRDSFSRDPVGLVRELLESPHDGRVKMFCLWRLLQTRRQHRKLFTAAAYRPLEFAGEHRDSVFGFARELDRTAVLVIVPRMVSRLGAAGFPVGKIWDDTTLILPGELSGTYTCAFTGHVLDLEESLELPKAMAHFPACVLVRPQGG
jgi:(1->4)-alpha-D-glucan 1-alpha-D-glucosylmutase